MNAGHRVVKFVDLNVREINSFGMDYYRYHSLQSLDGAVHISEDRVVEVAVDSGVRVVPIHRICHSARKDLYIAYSQEVQELLEIPINSITAELRSMTHERDQASNLHANLVHTVDQCTQLSFIDRLQHLILGRRFAHAFLDRYCHRVSSTT